ncbi:hypothetical protein LRS06_08460 [Hymenobacter sp. J193]|uniref:hypothetical protein n=1 Tax=Hymenobacter sp. J193 TaxID=2898429 RepID=UPI00215136E4|nr:hypothetical protein [Hymenobacter sp. J193]MCR5887809.1 hypothetical protein [Hymenobacter sp. J193]
MNKFLSFAALAASLTLSVAASAQEQATTASSNGSYRPIPNSDIMFRKTIWRMIDLREKQNKPMFSSGREISQVILDAVRRGELQAYKDDSLARTLTREEAGCQQFLHRSDQRFIERRRARCRPGCWRQLGHSGACCPQQPQRA